MKGTFTVSRGSDAWRSAIVKVNMVAAGGILVAAVGANFHLKGYCHASTMWTIAQIICIFAITALKDNVQMALLRFCSFLALSFSAGVNVGSWIHSALQETGFCHGSGLKYFPDIDGIAKMFRGSSSAYLKICKPDVMNGMVLEAFLMSLGIYAAISLTTYMSSSRNYARYGNILSMSMWVLFGSQILFYFNFIGQQFFEDIYVKFGLAVYCVKIMFDAEVTADQAQTGDIDVLSRSVDATMNFLHVFIRVITIMKDSQKKKNRRD